MFTLYIFLFGYLLGIISYVFLVEDEKMIQKEEEEIVKKYENKCKNEMLKLFEQRLKQD